MSRGTKARRLARRAAQRRIFAMQDEDENTNQRGAQMSRDLDRAERGHKAYWDAEEKVKDLEATDAVLVAELDRLNDDIRAARDKIVDAKTDVARATYPEKLSAAQQAAEALHEAWLSYRIWYGADSGTYADWLERTVFPMEHGDQDKALDSLFGR